MLKHIHNSSITLRNYDLAFYISAKITLSKNEIYVKPCEPFSHNPKGGQLYQMPNDLKTW